jgi:hypothetical protein
MDQIYELAWLTIVAANGHDVDAGLPGIQPGDRPRQVLFRQVEKGLSIGVYASTDLQLKRSVYETRAWTFVALAFLFTHPVPTYLSCHHQAIQSVLGQTLKNSRAKYTQQVSRARSLPANPVFFSTPLSFSAAARASVSKSAPTTRLSDARNPA